MGRLSIRHILILLVLTASTLAMTANNSKRFLIEKYQKQLSNVTNARDSLRILFNLYDLSDHNDKKKYGWLIYGTAGRSADETSQADILRNLAVYYNDNDSVIDILTDRADLISNTDRRNATKTFIRNLKLNKIADKAVYRHIEKILLDSLSPESYNKDRNIYDQISLLYHIIHYLGVDADGSLFRESLEKYSQLIETLPTSDYPLKKQFYTTASKIYSRYGDNPRKAVESDLYVLDIINQLELMYKKKKRIFRNYDNDRFLSYSRILSNYPDLTDKEIEMAYDSIIAISQRNSDVHLKIENDKSVYAYYYFAKKDYERALPAIRNAIENRNDMENHQLLRLYRMLMKSAKETGDEKTYSEAMELFIAGKDQLDSLRKKTMEKEMLLRDHINATSPQNQLKPGTKNKHDSIADKLTASYAVTAILALLLTIYIILYLRMRIRQ